MKAIILLFLIALLSACSTPKEPRRLVTARAFDQEKAADLLVSNPFVDRQTARLAYPEEDTENSRKLEWIDWHSWDDLVAALASKPVARKLAVVVFERYDEDEDPDGAERTRELEEFAAALKAAGFEKVVLQERHPFERRILRE